MIEFCGELSVECKKYILKKATQISFLSALMVAIVFLIPIIIATILWHWIFIIALPVLIMIVVLSTVRPPKKRYGNIIPHLITITDNKITSKGDSFSYSAPIAKVKKVVDFGSWFHIYFCYPFKDIRFVCQKDLIQKGTIVDFEKLFEEKIERKN